MVRIEGHDIGLERDPDVADGQQQPLKRTESDPVEKRCAPSVDHHAMSWLTFTDNARSSHTAAGIHCRVRAGKMFYRLATILEKRHKLTERSPAGDQFTQR